MAKNKNKTFWYAAGLHFECQQCGNCCSGPDEGYIWITKPEIKLLADFLKITVEKLREKFLKRIGFRTTIIEQPVNKDCIFLQKINGHRFDKLTTGKGCVVYSARPSQCRTWPFWAGNLKNPDTWNEAAQKCPGINRGKFYSAEQIKKIKKGNVEKDEGEEFS
ncbi:MAG: YkgJ family cysteine cluster protein [Planctomycetes bacterium]|nr:YkgJ family cysteine cluster protein [Planctomycetota bacterium]MCK5473619.1 YkgJ family cysteine cluster protein [Planctomycetota bacterium]